MKPSSMRTACSIPPRPWSKKWTPCLVRPLAQPFLELGGADVLGRHEMIRHHDNPVGVENGGGAHLLHGVEGDRPRDIVGEHQIASDRDDVSGGEIIRHRCGSGESFPPGCGPRIHLPWMSIGEEGPSARGRYSSRSDHPSALPGPSGDQVRRSVKACMSLR